MNRVWSRWELQLCQKNEVVIVQLITVRRHTSWMQLAVVEDFVKAGYAE